MPIFVKTFYNLIYGKNVNLMGCNKFLGVYLCFFTGFVWRQIGVYVFRCVGHGRRTFLFWCLSLWIGDVTMGNYLYMSNHSTYLPTRGEAAYTNLDDYLATLSDERIRRFVRQGDALAVAQSARCEVMLAPDGVTLMLRLTTPVWMAAGESMAPLRDMLACADHFAARATDNAVLTTFSIRI